jgi:membrane-bound lytic murein transglycosylase B
MNRPAEKVKPWYEYKKIFLTKSRTTKGLTFWNENKEALDYARKVYDVPQEIIVAIIGVETFYGRITGKHRVIDALSTLAFDYPKRSKFFRSELKHYLILCKEQGIDPLSLKGSYAGAMGYGQFMPSSYQNYAVNFDGEGKKDIWNNTSDAIGSVANYFKQHGWLLDQPVIVPAILSKALLAEGDIPFNRRKLKPKITLKAFSKKGISSKLSQQNPEMKAAIIMLEEKSGPSYYLGFNNFYVISRYNHSHMYSMAVNLLSQDLRKAYDSQK